MGDGNAAFLDRMLELNVTSLLGNLRQPSDLRAFITSCDFIVY
jgi:hypothetical protein